jgi:hypothetical protein
MHSNAAEWKTYFRGMEEISEQQVRAVTLTGVQGWLQGCCQALYEL